MASLPRIGETISGFTVTELGTIHAGRQDRSV